MIQDVLDKIKQRIAFIKKVEELKKFWLINSKNITKITAHYFSFSNTQGYLQN